MSFAITPESNERKGAFMKRKWWHDKVAYQIYPKSFLDTNGDGIGDLTGIISKLDYLKDSESTSSGSPGLRIPFVDQGYDISDYYKIADSLAQWMILTPLYAEMKKRGMHLIMDLVVNHCSDKHVMVSESTRRPGRSLRRLLLFPRRKRRQGTKQLPLLFWWTCMDKSSRHK